MMENSPILAVVVPCYKEEAVLHETHKRLSQLFDRLIQARQISPESYILYVNDGSTDQTWAIIKELHQNTAYACGLNLAGNVGHQNALLAGLNAVKERCEIAISIDADLQDDIQVIPDMINSYKAGNDIVYGVRKERKTDTFFKRNTALVFYRRGLLQGDAPAGGGRGVQPRRLPPDEPAGYTTPMPLPRAQPFSSGAGSPHRLPDGQRVLQS